jgi:hypothetical protein
LHYEPVTSPRKYISTKMPRAPDELVAVELDAGDSHVDRAALVAPPFLLGFLVSERLPLGHDEILAGLQEQNVNITIQDF